MRANMLMSSEYVKPKWKNNAFR